MPGSPTRAQVREALTAGWYAAGTTASNTLDGMVDAVMALLAEAPQPRVLWAGETEGDIDGSYVEELLLRGVPSGTKVALVVIEDTETPECPVCVEWAGCAPADHVCEHAEAPARCRECGSPYDAGCGAADHDRLPPAPTGWDPVGDILRRREPVHGDTEEAPTEVVPGLWCACGHHRDFHRDGHMPAPRGCGDVRCGCARFKPTNLPVHGDTENPGGGDG